MKGIRARYNLSILVLLAGLVFHGCAGIYTLVEFEILEPAKVEFPDQVKKLIILNRSPLTFDAFEKHDRQGMNTKQLISIDNLIWTSIKTGLTEVLKDSPIESFRHPLWIKERREDTTAIDDLILTKREVNEICMEHGGQIIVSLESYSMDIWENKEYYKNDPSIIQKLSRRVFSVVKWNIYLRDSPKPYHSLTLSDTLVLKIIEDGFGQSSLPVSLMIKKAFEESGTTFGRYLVPAWKDASRTLYNGKEDSLRMAMEFTDRGDWISAFKIWEGMSSGNDSTSAAKALNNMAIYFELEDNLEMASLMINRAMEHDTLAPIKSYKKTLDKRIQNKNEVIKQVH